MSIDKYIVAVIDDLNKQGIMLPEHIKLFKENKKYGEIDGFSLLYKYLKIPEQVLVTSLNKVQKDIHYATVVVSQTEDVIAKNKKLVGRYSALVLYKSADTGEYVIAGNNLSSLKIQEIGRLLNCSVISVSVIPEVLKERIIEIQMLTSPIKKPTHEDTEDLTLVESLFDLIVVDAIAADATDIHLEFLWDKDLMDYLGIVRFRSNPDLIKWTKHKFSITEMSQMKSILCTRAGKNTGDANRQEGYTFQHNLNYPEYEFRVSFMAHQLLRNSKTSLARENKDNDLIGTITGYSCTIRIQETNKLILKPEDLNLGDDIVAELHQAYNTKSGITCITGAPGAGKNTTYSSIVNANNNREMIVWEVGSPIEYKLPITQINVESYEHMKNVVKTSKTQDIDKIIITEFRDSEMGHLIKDTVISNMSVLLTMHITRVWDFIEKYREYFGPNDYRTMVMYTRQISHQVMFKKLCDNCKKPLHYKDMNQQERDAYKSLKLEGTTVYIANRDEDSDCRIQCLGGFLTTRLPAAESLLLTRQDKRASVLLDNMLSADTEVEMRNLVKNYMVNNGKSLEYKIRERIINGEIDFREVIRLEIFEEVQSEK